MIEIRMHGRGGQGAVKASIVLAEAAFQGGKYVQAFPRFGVERRGAPVEAFTRIDDKPVQIGLVEMDAVEKGIDSTIPRSKEANKKAALQAYDSIT